MAVTSSSEIGFLGVGPEKTGTTWLHAVLAQHPELWLPPRKELSYFWQDIDYPGETAMDRLTKDNWHHKRYRRYAKSRVKEWLRHPRYTWRHKGAVAWDLHHLLKKHDDDWYLSSFRGSPSQTPGEISPQYFFMPRQQVEKALRMCPKAKIIITLREPRQWVWSFARMLVRDGEIALDSPEMENFIDTKIATNSFAAAYRKWLSVFPEDQVKIFFFEDMTADPWTFYLSVCEFLGLEARPSVRDTLDKRVNSGKPMAIPEHLQDRIRQGWSHDVRELEAMLGRVPEEWLAEIAFA